MLSSFAFLVCFSSLLFLAATLVRRWRLSSIPGPLFASFTDLWQFYYQNRYRFTDVLTESHNTYGPLVRIGPNRISVSKASMVRSIYTMHGEFKKAKSYHALRVSADGQVRGSMIDIDDEQKVKNLKRGVGNIFSVHNVLKYEDDIDETAVSLFRKLHTIGTVDLFSTLQQFQIDFLMKIAFTEHQGYLQTDKDPIAISGHGRLSHFLRFQSMPYLEHLYYKTPFLRKYFKKSAIPLWMAWGMEIMSKRQLGLGFDGNANPDLLDKYMEAAEKLHEPDLVPTMIASTISAGFDTTAYTMSAMLCLLLSNPQTFTKLRNEVDNAGLSDPPKSSEVDKLEYLAATIKEAMRMHPFLNLVLERIVPHGGTEIEGYWFPGGTVVGCHAGVVGRDRECFGEDVDTFRPERWLTSDPEERLAMERGHLGFGGGNRVCLGRHLAELEIKKIISSVLLKFELKLEDPNTKFEPRDNLTAFPRSIMVTFKGRI